MKYMSGWLAPFSYICENQENRPLTNRHQNSFERQTFANRYAAPIAIKKAPPENDSWKPHSPNATSQKNVIDPPEESTKE